MLRSEEMKAVLEERAKDALSRLGPGYESVAYTGRNRVNVSIRPSTRGAIRENLKDNKILKALR